MSDDEKNKENDSFEEIDQRNSDDEKMRENEDDDKFNLFIKQITGNSTMITCSPTEKISRVKELIAEN